MTIGSTACASQLDLSIEETSKKTIVRCTGKIISETCALLLDTTCNLISQGKCIVVDLRDVSFIDSSGLGALVNVWSSAKKRSAEVDIRWREPHASVSDLKIANKRIRELFRLTRLDRVFGGDEAEK